MNIPIAAAERPRIAVEFASIQQPELTRRVAYTELTETNSVGIEATYKAATATWADLRAHFDRVLERKAGHFSERRELRSGASITVAATLATERHRTARTCGFRVALMLVTRTPFLSGGRLDGDRHASSGAVDAPRPRLPRDAVPPPPSGLTYRREEAVDGY